MRIAIDARMMGPEHTRGIGRYIEEIVRAMIAIAPEHRYILLERDPGSSPFADSSCVEHLKADVPWYGLAEQIRMPRIIKRANADVLFAPHWNISWFCPIRRVVFIHDLILLEEPDSANLSTRNVLIRKIKRLGHRLILRRALYTSRAILVPTQHVADRIGRHYPSCKTPIIVTGEGITPISNPSPNNPTTQQPNNPSLSPYLLTVGSAYPHKNHDLVFRAWPEISKHHPDLRLVIVGKKDAFMSALQERVLRERLENIEFVGAISDAELSNLYAGAFALVFPSRWEGFALPPLEALGAGTPVLSSQTSCMPEVLGSKGVIFFNPSSEHDMMRAVEELFQNADRIRNDAKEAARELAKRHDWHLAARKTLNSLQSAIPARGRQA